ncbi:Tagatose-6-phosphate kinase [Corynebacterium capitovis DSM 44611]|uniref:1-phosphofructokinase family hexose kinase n=1 Tax=Corynebacterium capitovis TaxID=131081 RepID=UPI0003788E4C|nr:1-phosphofructokinase family hexose kinase [Corynebacterium capitovis]WKD57516.1 Tagatose-6-phosphate kinase [Corynebacterium capitovis DSM 44611]
MIITLTPNPSIDATLELDSLARGGVCRVSSAHREAGGKGINVAHAVAKAGEQSLALAPAGADDPFLTLARAAGIPVTTTPITGVVRTNTTLTEPDGTTTKINEPGPELSRAESRALVTSLESNVAETKADAVVLAGSLPSGVPEDWYAELVAAARDSRGEAIIAVDTSDAALIALGRTLDADPRAPLPTVLKPNAFELGQLTGRDGVALEESAERGDFGEIVVAARSLTALGVKEVLVTLGGAGACLVTGDGAWGATPPPIAVRSTVGAGDSSLAGYVMSRVRGSSHQDSLRTAVAYGSAAASLPGTGIPSPTDLDIPNTHVFPVT